MAEEYMYLGEVPKSVYDKELKAYLARRKKSNAKRVPAQFEYNGKKYTFQKAGNSYQVKHAGERVLKEAKRRVAESKQSVKLSSVEQMMVENIYDEASQRGLAVDHVFPVAKGGPTNAPWNLKLMEPSVNSAKGAKVGGNWKYEPLIAKGGSIKFGAALGALPAVGAIFDAGDVQAGVEGYMRQEQTPMQQFGSGLQAVSGATGLAAMVPTPASPVLGATSAVTGGAAAAVQSGAVEKAIQATPAAAKKVQQIERILNPVGASITNELKYIGGQVRLGKIPYFN